MNEHWTEFEIRQGLEQVKPILNAIQGNGFIAGSYAAWMANLHAVEPGDIDVFFISLDYYETIRFQLYDEGYGLEERNELVYTLSHPDKKNLQLIKPNPEWHCFPDDILNSFDLDISRAVLVNEKTILADTNVGLRDAKFIRINNPLKSLQRMIKYHDRGVRFNDHELVKLFQAWDEVSAERKAEIIERARLDSIPSDPIFGYSFYSDDEYYDAE